MDIEEQLRHRVTTGWAALQSAKSGSSQEVEAFRRYCDALNDAGRYAAEQVRLSIDGERGSVMKIALRVLAAINQRQAPRASDVAMLRACLPNAGDRADDEVACEVIQQEMSRRARTRSVGES
jgi:hypothetical protein